MSSIRGKHLVIALVVAAAALPPAFGVRTQVRQRRLERAVAYVERIGGTSRIHRFSDPERLFPTTTRFLNDLRDLPISDADLDALGDALEGTATEYSINLSGTRVSEPGWPALMERLGNTGITLPR